MTWRSLLVACLFVVGIARTDAATTAAVSAAKAAAMAFDAQLIALVKATPKLRIDTSVPRSPGFDAKSQPYVDIVGLPEGEAVGGYLDAGGAHRGTLANGYAVLAVPLESGGSGGVFTQIVFARRTSGVASSAKYAYAGYVSSAGHLDVRVRNGVIVATLPYYGPKDPNCCPSKMIVQTYAIQAGSLHKLSDKTIPTPKPR